MRAHRRQDLTEDLTKTDQTTWPEQSGAILARMTQASGISQSMRRGDESRSASASEYEWLARYEQMTRRLELYHRPLRAATG